MTSRELIWSPDAIADLQEIADYIARDKRDGGRRPSLRSVSRRWRCPSLGVVCPSLTAMSCAR